MLPCWLRVVSQVYSSQMQLGGPRVMGENGVSHYVVNDDLEGVKVILRWLSYCPAQLGAEPPLLPTNDPVDRPVAYELAAHEKFDPRSAIMGEHELAVIAFVVCPRTCTWLSQLTLLLPSVSLQRAGLQAAS